MNKETPYVLSIAYKDPMDDICKGLARLGLKYFVMYIVFNDGSRFVLSNIYHLLIPYYTDGFYKEDFSYNLKTTNNLDFYLCDKTKSISDNFKEQLENRFNVHRAYYIIRRCVECSFIFGAIKDINFDSCTEIYNNTINDFEIFCIDFVDCFSNLIVSCNIKYKNSFILTNNQLRRAVIKGSYPKKEELTNREKECLRLVSRGKTAKEVAKNLSISPFTVEKYYKNIREKLHCSTIIESVVEGIHRGIIGSINPQFNNGEANLIRGFKIVNNMQIAKIEISKTNLALLNSW